MIRSNHSITEIKRDIKNKIYSHKELTEFFLRRIERANTELNCFITICRDTAIEEALADGDFTESEAKNLFNLYGNEEGTILRDIQRKFEI